MLILLAAMTVAAAGPAEVQPLEPPTAIQRPFIFPRSLSMGDLAARRHCKDAARLQTGYEPALLYRQRDRDKARKLIDLPQGAMCLVGEPEAARPSGGR